MSRLRISFKVAAPDVDESPLAGETPSATAQRLAELKARAVGQQFPGALVLGADQVAELDGQPLGKPGTRERAEAQLRVLSGRCVVFHSAVALLNTASGKLQQRLVQTSVTFRTLSDANIRNYLDLEPALDCAGSAKSEGLGIALIAKLEGNDPNALVGLPLIALVDMLHAEGWPLL